MPLVSRMLIAARGTRGAPRPPTKRPRTIREPRTEFQRVLYATLSRLPIERPELGLPLRCGEFVDVLLDPAANLRTDLPAIAPEAAVEVLLELAHLERRWCDDDPDLQAQLAAVAAAVHLAMNRWLVGHRETDPWIRLAESNFDPARFLSGELRQGPVANALLDALRNTVLLDLDRRLRSPIDVRTWSGGATIVLVVLGCLRYYFNRVLFTTAVRVLGANGRLEEARGAKVRPLAPLGTWHWIARVVNLHGRMIRATAASLANDPDELEARQIDLGEWLACSVRVRMRRTVDLRPLRHVIRAAMPFSREALVLACRIRRDPRASLTTADVDRVEQRLTQYRAIAAANPRLLHLAALLPRPAARPGPPDPQQLKKLLRDNGLSKNAWRLLCRHGAGVYAPAIDSWWFRQDRWDALVSIANLIVACQRDGLPPPELLRYLADVEDQNPHDDALVAPILFRAAWGAMRLLRGPRARRAFVEDRFARAVSWWWAAGHGCRAPGGARWAWFDAAAAAWQARERIARRDAEAWSCPIESFDAVGIRIVPLCSPLALWDEAQALRHCVWTDGFVDRCRKGELQVFGVRDARSGRRLATAAFTRTPGQPYELWQLGGFANQPMDRADVNAVAEATLAALNRHAAAGPPQAPPEENPGARAA